jgi:hypothetical protein
VAASASPHQSADIRTSVAPSSAGRWAASPAALWMHHQGHEDRPHLGGFFLVSLGSTFLKVSSTSAHRCCQLRQRSHRVPFHGRRADLVHAGARGRWHGQFAARPQRPAGHTVQSRLPDASGRHFPATWQGNRPTSAAGRPSPPPKHGAAHGNDGPGQPPGRRGPGDDSGRVKITRAASRSATPSLSLPAASPSSAGPSNRSNPGRDQPRCRRLPSGRRSRWSPYYCRCRRPRPRRQPRPSPRPHLRPRCG